MQSQLGAALAVIVSFSTVVSARAASPITDAFLANVRPNVEFLDHSSKLAAEKSASAAVHDYAQSESAEAVFTASAASLCA